MELSKNKLKTQSYSKHIRRDHVYQNKPRIQKTNHRIRTADARHRGRINTMQATSFYVSKSHLNAIATRALIDEDFKAGVLNGKRSQKIKEYPLPEFVQQEVMRIQAEDVRQFIYGLQAIIEHSQA